MAILTSLMAPLVVWKKEGKAPLNKGLGGLTFRFFIS